MSYSNFTLELVVSSFNLTINTDRLFFADIPPVAPSGYLQQTLDRELLWSLQVGTEIARREGIIHPIMMELRSDRVAVFSGKDFTVDESVGLNGYCDYIVSLDPSQALIQSPVAIIAEAKKGELDSGMGQCVAGMVGALKFNQQKQKPIETIYGTVTNGSIWRFMKLTGELLEIDFSEYSVPPVDRVLGILKYMIGANT